MPCKIIDSRCHTWNSSIFPIGETLCYDKYMFNALRLCCQACFFAYNVKMKSWPSDFTVTQKQHFWREHYPSTLPKPTPTTVIVCKSSKEQGALLPVCCANTLILRRQGADRHLMMGRSHPHFDSSLRKNALHLLCLAGNVSFYLLYTTIPKMHKCNSVAGIMLDT